jgi:hypothetical protein
MFSSGFLCGLSGFGLLLGRYVLGGKSVPFPPGPPALPILGNIFNWPSTKAHLTFASWARKYGGNYSSNTL